MNPSLDLNLLFLARQGGIEKDELPDLYAATPPRRAAHGRESDSLIIYLSMSGNSPLSPEAHTQLLERLALKFYKSSGSLTAALRTLVEALNVHLLDRNLHSTSMGRQGIGQLILVALRADTLYITQCGGVHAFLMTTTETQHLHDPQSSGRGLGLSRTTPMRFLQVKIKPDDFMVLSTQASSSWTGAALLHPQRQGIETLRRQLVERGGQDFSAVILQAQAGTGKLRLIRRQAGDAISSPTPRTPTAGSRLPAPAIQSEAIPQQPVEDNRPGLPAVPVPTPTTPVNTTLPQVEDHGLGLPASPEPAVGTQTDEAPLPVIDQPPVVPLPVEPAHRSLPEPVKPKRERPTPEVLRTIRGTLSKVGVAILRALRSSLATVAGALLRLLKSLLPDADVLRLPPSMMIFIALAIPLVLATIGGMVYLQRGKSQQHEVFYQQAEEDAAYATTLTNPLEQRMAWLTVIGDLDKAENYSLTSKSQALRLQAMENIDNLDATKRLTYQPAIVGGLDSGVRVIEMVATATDLYMLNAEQGSVIRAIMTGRGYEIDPNFQCGPTYGPIDVGPLVDIAELPPGAFENASLLGMDAKGNLLYCVVGSQPYSAVIAQPNTGLGEPKAMTLDRNDFYVLDPEVNAVWMYRNLEVSQQPRLFFGNDVPPMADAIDLAVYNEDLYLLHADGHITKCTFSSMAESPTRCEEPYPYSDNRPGRVHGPVIEDTVFSHIYFLSFPERSIYLLDPQNQSIYYFSVLLNLQWQARPRAELAEGKASAFAISPNRTAFLAIGNNVYYAALP